MNRLQKKCFIVSAGLHLFLVAILFIGPAFLSSSSKPIDVPLIDFVPVKTVDALLSGGGNPRGQSPPQTQPITPPAPAPVPAAVPPAPTPEIKEPAKEVKPPEPEAVSMEPSPKPQPKKPNISTTLVKRNSSDSKAAADTRAQDIAARRKAATEASRALAGIKTGLSQSTTIEFQGRGGGGVPYANFLQAVKKIYTDAWLVPSGIDDDSATATVSVTIARDGKVISANIIRSSGNAAVDQSVQATLDRVRYTPPLPDDAKENQRTVTINFNVKAKLLG
jgi:periplasmic protein TonB